MLKELARRSLVTAREIKFSLGKEFYTQPQDYKVMYNVEITNTGSDNKVDVVLPFPSQTSYQRIDGSAWANTPSNYKPVFKSELVYCNEYVAWCIELLPFECLTLGLMFNASILPRDTKVDNKFSVSDYSDYPRRHWWPLRHNTYPSKSVPVNRDINSLADRLVGKEQNIAKILNTFNKYVIEKLEYGDPITGLYSASDALVKDKVDCGGYVTLMASLCRSKGIFTRVLSGFWAGYENNGMHAWLEVMLPNDKWIPVDPSIEQLFKQGRTRKFGKLGYVGSDRVVLSQGSDLKIELKEGAKYEADILQNPIVVAERGPNSIYVSSRFITKQRVGNRYKDTNNSS